MKKFRFPLQRTMEWRQHQTEQQKAELERLYGLQKSLSDQRENAQKSREELVRNSAQTVVIAAEQLHQMASFGQSLLNLEQHLRGEQQRCEARIEQQRKRCLESDRDHQLLVRMHDEQRRQWQYEWNREVEAAAAEIWTGGQSVERSRSKKSD